MKKIKLPLNKKRKLPVKNLIVSILLLCFVLSTCLMFSSCAFSEFLDIVLRESEEEPDVNGGTGESQSNQTKSTMPTVKIPEIIDIMDKGPVRGGTLKLFTTKPDTFNPLFTKNSYVQDFLNLVYEGLTKLNEKQEAIPALSDKWSVSSDGLVWNFHIRQGVKWHDGAPLTPADVEYTVKTIIENKAGSQYKPLFRDVLTYAAVDNENFKFVLSKPNSFFAELMSFPVMPAHLAEDAAKSITGTALKPVGTGPYSFKFYLEDKKIELAANRSWWFTALSAENQIYIDNLDIMVFKSPGDAIDAFQTNEIDMAGVDSSNIGNYLGRTDIIIRKFISRKYEFLSFNMNNEVTGDIFVRQAVNRAINKKQIIDSIYNGNAVEANLPVSPECWLYENVSGNGGESLYTPFAPGIEKDAAPDTILTAGGWSKGSKYYHKTFNGVRKDLKLEIITAAGNPQRIKMANMISDQLNAAGIAASVLQLEWKELMARIDSGKYDIAAMGLSTGRSSDISYLYSSNPVFSHGYSYSDPARNISGYNNPVLDDYFQKLLAEEENNLKKVHFNNIRNLLDAELPYIGICFLDDAIIYRKIVRGKIQPHSWDKYFDISRWYLPG